ncbi:MAG TPA: hypothetical protein EYP30_07630 [Archaeoglobaceae archaeon]|nr:hypothetical protein [Archaeoglobaceae archaeon]
MMVSQRTRIAGLSFSNKRPIIGETVTVAAYLQWYDQKAKRWEPVERKKVDVYIDNEKVGEVITDHLGYFTFECEFRSLGNHIVEIKFDGFRDYFMECSVSRTLKVITESQKRNLEKHVKIITVIALLILLTVIILAIRLST